MLGSVQLFDDKYIDKEENSKLVDFIFKWLRPVRAGAAGGVFPDLLYGVHHASTMVAAQAACFHPAPHSGMSGMNAVGLRVACALAGVYMPLPPTRHARMRSRSAGGAPAQPAAPHPTPSVHLRTHPHAHASRLPPAGVSDHAGQGRRRGPRGQRHQGPAGHGLARRQAQGVFAGEAGHVPTSCQPVYLAAGNCACSGSGLRALGPLLWGCGSRAGDGRDDGRSCSSMSWVQVRAHAEEGSAHAAHAFVYCVLCARSLAQALH